MVHTQRPGLKGEGEVREGGGQEGQDQGEGMNLFEEVKPMSLVPYDIPSSSSSEVGSNVEMDTDVPTASHEIEINLDPTTTMESEVKQEQEQGVKEEVKREILTPKRNPVRKARAVRPSTPPPPRPKRKVATKPDEPKRKPADAEPQPGPSRRSESTGRRKLSIKGKGDEGDQTPAFIRRLGAHVYYGKSLPSNFDLEDYDTQIILRARFFHRLRKWIADPKKEIRVVEAEWGPSVEDIKSVEFILGIREFSEDNQFVDHRFGSVKVIGPFTGWNCSTLAFQITDEAVAQQLGCTVARMVLASEEVFGLTLGDEKAFGW